MREAELTAARTTVLDSVRRSLAEGGLPLRPADVGMRGWRSQPGWLGPLSQTEERALVFVAVDVVQRVATSPAWLALDDHRVRLDPATELAEIDLRAYELAVLRRQLGDRRDAVLGDSWTALVDRVAALVIYAERLRELETEPTAELADEHVARLMAGAAGDELAAGHVHDLAGELPTRDVTDQPSSPTA
ncbi:MAG TPA: hypothetical protein VFW65_23505 [Pseudonocardiaceae bacterium]|nr:hypothetical protein [Pseudonocardiaceae bacterium]